jgi:hypothetical protein
VEIPDAIGWSSRYSWYGSTVIECKTSVSDFYADKKKRHHWKKPGTALGYRRNRLTETQAKEMGFVWEAIPMMGNYRFYMCEPGVLSVALVEKHAADHGLLIIKGRGVQVMRLAPKREMVDYESEVRFLRFAIINSKVPHKI